MKNLSYILFVALLLLCLSGCEFSTFTSPGDLLAAPKLTGENQAIEEAFESAVGTDISLMTPKTGDYLSSYILYDIDKDLADECLVFYKTNNDTGRFAILDSRDEVWSVVADLTAPGSSVISVQFCDICGDDIPEIFITWNILSSGDSKCLTVYGGYDSEILRFGTVKNLVTENYSSCYIEDADDDGKDEIFTILREIADNKYIYNASLLDEGTDGSLTFCDSTALSIGSAEISEILTDNTDQCRFFIDFPVSDGYIATTVVEYSTDGGLYEIPDISNLTIRRSDFLCTDADNDGEIEIPIYETCPGAEDENGDELFLTGYSVFRDNDLTIKEKILTLSDGITINWTEILDKITVTDGNIVNFYVYNAENDTTGYRLFFIAKTDGEIPENGIILKKSHGISYYAAITVDGEARGITAELLKSIINIEEQ